MIPSEYTSDGTPPPSCLLLIKETNWVETNWVVAVSMGVGRRRQVGGRVSEWGGWQDDP